MVVGLFCVYVYGLCVGVGDLLVLCVVLFY